MPYQGPYRVMYYVHDIFSNQEDYYRQRYCQIMLKEEAEMKAKGLLNDGLLQKSKPKLYEFGNIYLRAKCTKSNCYGV